MMPSETALNTVVNRSQSCFFSFSALGIGIGMGLRGFDAAFAAGNSPLVAFAAASAAHFAYSSRSSTVSEDAS